MQRYEILGDIASGGMGVVSVARLHGERGFAKLVAVKRIHSHLGANAQFHDLLAREARLASLVHHPAIVQVHELTSQDGELMLVMDYVEGSSLRRILDGLDERQDSLPHDVAVRIGLEAARALDAMHRARDEAGLPLGIVHRDVSPQNVLVSFRGEVKLMDFGIATALEADHGTTSTVRGKPAYLAPEQLRGERADERADLWALGVILWEMLAGQRLFRGANDFETVQRVQDGPLLRLDEIDEQQFERPLADAVASALTRDKTQRIASAAELVKRLERACPAALAVSPDQLASWARRGAPNEEARLRALCRPPSPSMPPSPSPGPSRPIRRGLVALLGALLGFVGVRTMGLQASTPTPRTEGVVSTPVPAPPSDPDNRPVAPPPFQAVPQTPTHEEVSAPESPSGSPTPPGVPGASPALAEDSPAGTTDSPRPTSEGTSRVPTRRRSGPATTSEEPPRQDREGSSSSTTMMVSDPTAPMTQFPL